MLSPSARDPHLERSFRAPTARSWRCRGSPSSRPTFPRGGLRGKSATHPRRSATHPRRSATRLPAPCRDVRRPVTHAPTSATYPATTFAREWALARPTAEVPRPTPRAPRRTRPRRAPTHESRGAPSPLTCEDGGISRSYAERPQPTRRGPRGTRRRRVPTRERPRARPPRPARTEGSRARTQEGPRPTPRATARGRASPRPTRASRAPACIGAPVPIWGQTEPVIPRWGRKCAGATKRCGQAASSRLSWRHTESGAFTEKGALK